MLTVRAAILAMSAALVGVAAAASSQSRADYRSYYGGPFPQVNVPFSSRDVGIAGPVRSCVKWCDRDMNPCDPPVYKQADGRCSYER